MNRIIMINMLVKNMHMIIIITVMSWCGEVTGCPHKMVGCLLVCLSFVKNPTSLRDTTRKFTEWVGWVRKIWRVITENTGSTCFNPRNVLFQRLDFMLHPTLVDCNSPEILGDVEIFYIFWDMLMNYSLILLNYSILRYILGYSNTHGIPRNRFQVVLLRCPAHPLRCLRQMGRRETSAVGIGEG